MTEEEQNKLNQDLYDAIGSGDVEAVRALLEKGANVNPPLSAGHWTPLMNAAYSGHSAIADLLLRAGADKLVQCNGYTAADQAQRYSHSTLADAIRNYVPETADQVRLYSQFSNRVREHIFDFAELERVTLIRSELYGPVEAAYSKNFSELGSDATLREAFNEHVKRGGKVAEEAVFGNLPRKLDKPGLA